MCQSRGYRPHESQLQIHTSHQILTFIPYNYPDFVSSFRFRSVKLRFFLNGSNNILVLWCEDAIIVFYWIWSGHTNLKLQILNLFNIYNLILCTVGGPLEDSQVAVYGLLLEKDDSQFRDTLTRNDGFAKWSPTHAVQSIFMPSPWLLP